jgi:hypothetical protein
MASLVLKLTGDDAHKIRGKLAPDGMQVFSVFDFITIACIKNDKGAFARKWYGDNIKNEDSEYYDEFDGQIHTLKFTGNIFLMLFEICILTTSIT